MIGEGESWQMDCLEHIKETSNKIQLMGKAVVEVKNMSLLKKRMINEVTSCSSYLFQTLEFFIDNSDINKAYNLLLDVLKKTLFASWNSRLPS